jgi:transcriptional regulator with XRE-family HTH domain
MLRLIFPLSEKEAKKAKVQYSSEQNKNALFPSRLRELRNDAKLSQEQFSKEIGVTKSTISLYETGDNVPDIKTFTKIAEYFGVSFDFMLGKSESKIRENIDISKRLGLSDKAINVISNFDSEKQKILSTIIENDKFREILSGINGVMKQKSVYDKYILGMVEIINEADDKHAMDIIVRLGELNDVVASISNLNESTDYKVISTKVFIRSLRYELNNIFEGIINEVTYFKDFDTNIFTRLMQLIDAGDDNLLYKLKMKALKSAQDGEFEKSIKKGLENFIMSKRNIEKQSKEGVENGNH